MRTRDLVLAVAAMAAVSVLVPSVGRADSHPPLDTAPAQRAHWYGAPILLADAAAVTAVTVAFSRREDIPALATVGALSYLFAPPVIHMVHGRPRRALVSLAARFSLPVLGLAIGHGAGSDTALVAGFTVGAGLAMIADQALAVDRHPVEAPAPARSAAIQPYLQPLARGGAIGLTGRF